MKYIVQITTLMLILSGCAGKKTESLTNEAIHSAGNRVMLTEAQYKNVGIATGTVSKKAISGILRLNGKIDVPPQNMVSISIPLGGFLKSTRLLPGMQVRKGETIAIVEDLVYIQMQQDYLTANARLAFLEKELQRQRELNRSQASSDKVYQQAEAEYLADKILVTSLSEKLRMAGINPASINQNRIVRDIRIVAPINGFVSRVNANIGKYISPTDVLFELVNPADIHLSLKVFEKDLDKLYIGQQVFAYNNSLPDRKYPCKILLIGYDLSPDRSAEVHCHFENYDRKLIPGTYMNGEVHVRNTETEVVPEEAIVQFEGKSYVFAMISSRVYEFVEVQPGESENGFVQINSPSFEQRRIVIKGSYSLLMMLKNKAE